MINYVNILTIDERKNALFYFEQNINDFKNSKYITCLFKMYKNVSEKPGAVIALWLDTILEDPRVQKNIKNRVYTFFAKLDGIRSVNMVIYKKRNHLDN